MATKLHFTEDAFALHLLLQRFERLIDIVVTNQNLHLVAVSCLDTYSDHSEYVITPLRANPAEDGAITRPFPITKMFWRPIFGGRLMACACQPRFRTPNGVMLASRGDLT